jgi:hypothetical protein
MAWIDLAEDRDRWRALVNAAMNFLDWVLTINKMVKQSRYRPGVA